MASWWSDQRRSLKELDAPSRARFIARLRVGEPDKCWIWPGGLTFDWNRRAQPVYRVSYRVFYDVDPWPRVVRHNCDNPRCVNPVHLSLGSQRDNLIDATIRQRRQSNGSEKKTGTLEIALAIIKAFEAGESPDQIAARFGKSPQYVRDICTGRKWTTARAARDRISRDGKD